MINSKHDEFCIKNDEFCIYDDEFGPDLDELCGCRRCEKDRFVFKKNEKLCIKITQKRGILY